MARTTKQAHQPLTTAQQLSSIIKSARDKITPGTSALFLMSSDVVTDKVKAAFEEGGEFKPELIQSNLSNEQEAALREMIAS